MIEAPHPADTRARSADDVAAGRQVLSFRLGAQTHGIQILRVREIRAFQTPTPVARLPPAVLGVHNLRGEIVPIVDLNRLLGRDTRANDGGSRATIMLALPGGHTVGAVVDEVCDVLDVPDEAMPGGADAGGPHDELGLQVLDIDRLFERLGLFDAVGSEDIAGAADPQPAMRSG